MNRHFSTYQARKALSALDAKADAMEHAVVHLLQRLGAWSAEEREVVLRAVRPVLSDEATAAVTKTTVRRHWRLGRLVWLRRL
jgi:hypothetical protein